MEDSPGFGQELKEVCIFGGDFVNPGWTVSCCFVVVEIDIPSYIARVASPVLEADVLFYTDWHAMLRLLDLLQLRDDESSLTKGPASFPVL